MKKLLIILLCSWSHLIFCQVEIIPEIGSYFYATNGINDFDSIRVHISDENLGDVTIGLMVRKSLTNQFLLATRFTYRPNTVRATTYNFVEQCTFCPVEKISFLAPSSFLVNPSIEMKFPNFLSAFEAHIAIGFLISLNRSTNDPPITFNGRNPGVAEAINSYNKSIKPISISPTFGINLLLKNRIQFSVVYSPPSIFTNEVILFSRRYPFSNSWEFLNFSFGYRLYILKKL